MKKRISAALGGLFATAGLAAAQPAAAPPAQPAQVLSAPVEYSGGAGDPDGSVPRLWGSAEYLVWWVRSGPGIPVVLTTSTNTGFAPTNGALGAKGTVPLLGGHDEEYGGFSGVRATVGGWLGDEGTLGVEASGFLLERRSTSEGTSSAGNALSNSPRLFVPFTDLTPGFAGNTAQLLAGPGVPGGAALRSALRLWGTEGNAVLNLARGGGLTVDALAGFRFLSLEEGTDYFTFDRFPLPAFLGGGNVTVATADSYGTQNRFYGGQAGLRAEYAAGRFFASTAAKVALGDSHEAITINGLTVSSFPGEPTSIFQGGYYTAKSNIGRVTRDHFAVVPEVQLNFGVRLTDSLRAFIGYDFLYWSDVVRPGNQIDTRFGLPGVPTNPRVASDFWAQGLNLGLGIRY